MIAASNSEPGAGPAKTLAFSVRVYVISNGHKSAGYQSDRQMDAGNEASGERGGPRCSRWLRPERLQGVPMPGGHADRLGRTSIRVAGCPKCRGVRAERSPAGGRSSSEESKGDLLRE